METPSNVITAVGNLMVNKRGFSTILVLIAFFLIGCRSTPWRKSGIAWVEAPPPCSDVLVQEYLLDIDTVDVCEQYLRIERALMNHWAVKLNTVIPNLPGATCRVSRWGVSPDWEIDENLAVGLLRCYSAKMGREEEYYRHVTSFPVDVKNGLGQHYTYIPQIKSRDEFLVNLKAYLGCTIRNEGR